jgi:hypothetical protein
MPGGIEKRPFPIIPGKSDNTFLYLFSYSGDKEDFAADKLAYDTELKKHFMIDQTTPVPENGIGVTGTDLTIAAVTTQRTIALTTGDITAEIKHPVVMYKGEPIPFSDYESVAPTAGLITLIAGTDTIYDSVIETDYVVYYTDHVLGLLVSADVGGITLPIESNAFKAIGHVEPVVEVQRRGDAEQTGTISVITSLSSILFNSQTTPENFAGEELFARIYGGDWSPNAGFAGRQRLNFNNDPFGICVLMVSGKALDSGDAGDIWARMLFIYHCELTSISSPQNLTNDTTDPILQNVEFRAKYPVPEFATTLTS